MREYTMVRSHTNSVIVLRAVLVVHISFHMKKYILVSSHISLVIVVKNVHRSSLYTSEKLSLCKLKAVKYYLLAYQYIFIPPNPPTYFWRIFLESQPWIDHNSTAYMRRVSNIDTHLGENISMQMLQRFLRNGDLPGIWRNILGGEHISATNMTIRMHITKIFISTWKRTIWSIHVNSNINILKILS